MGELITLPARSIPSTPDEWERARQRAAASSALHVVLVDQDFSPEIATRVANTWAERGLMDAQNAKPAVRAAKRTIAEQERLIDVPRRRPNNVVTLRSR